MSRFTFARGQWTDGNLLTDLTRDRIIEAAQIKRKEASDATVNRYFTLIFFARDTVIRAGIHNFRWHDLRHTWASWLVLDGTPLYDMREMGSWKSPDMARRYAHLGPAQMARLAEVVGRPLEAQFRHRRRKCLLNPKDQFASKPLIL